MVVTPWYWYLQNSSIFIVTRLYLYTTNVTPSWSLIHGKLQLFSMNQYHIRHFYTLQNLIIRMKYRLNVSIPQNLCTHPKRILPKEFTSIILIYLGSQVIYKFYLTSINGHNEAKVSL